VRILLLSEVVLWAILLSTATTVSTRAAGGTNTLRIALTDFTSDENLYQSFRAATDFSQTLQAQVSPSVRCQWIERAEVQKIQNELHMSAFGLIDGGAAIRAGKWLKADVLLTGRFLREGAGRVLFVEVVDLRRGDVLSDTTIPLQCPTNQPLRRVLTEVAGVATQVRTLLDRAMETYDRVKNLRTITVLFFENATGRAEFDRFARDYEKAFDAMAQTNGSWRVLRFPRATRGRDEAELALSGFVESEPGTFGHPADVYVWGSLRAFNNRRITDKIDLNVWNGRSEPQVLSIPISTLNAHDQAARLIDPTLDALQKPDENAPTDTARQRVAATLLRRVQAILGTVNAGLMLFPHTLEGRRNLLELAQMLDVVCFLDPENAEAQVQRLRFMGNPMLFNLFDPVPFWAAWKKSEAWGKWVEHFGFDSLSTNASGAAHQSVGADYLYSISDLFDFFHRAERIQMGFPADVSLNVVSQWEARVMREFGRRCYALRHRTDMGRALPGILNGMPLLEDSAQQRELIEAIWPQIVAFSRTNYFRLDSSLQGSISNLYSQLGKRDEAERLFAMLHLLPSPSTPSPKAIREPESRKLNALFVAPQINVMPPFVEAPFVYVDFPSELQVHRVSSLAWHKNNLWFVSDAMELTSIQAINDVATELKNLRVERPQVWRYDPAATNLISFGNRLPEGEFPTVLCAFGDRLYVGSTGGVWLVNSESLTFDRRVDPNIPNVRCYSLAANENKVFVGDGHLSVQVVDAKTSVATKLTLKRHNPYAPGTAAKLVANGKWVVAFTGSTMLLNTLTGVEQLLDEELYGGAPIPRQSSEDAFPTWMLSGTADAANTFWIGSSCGLHCFDAQRNEVTNWFVTPTVTIANPLHSSGSSFPNADREAAMAAAFKTWRTLREQTQQRSEQFGLRANPLRPTSRLPGPVPALANDGDFLWVASRKDNTNYVLLWHKASARWVGHFVLPGQILDMVSSEDSLWVGMRGGRPLLRVLTAPLKSVPASRWVSDQVATTELDVVKGWPDSEQAVYAFFGGDYSRVIKLLDTENLRELDLESLYLLGCSYDWLGIHNSEMAGRYFNEIIAREQTGPWADEARQILETLRSRLPEEKRTKDLLARFDGNQDGQLDRTEKQKMQSDPVFRAEEKQIADRAAESRTKAEAERRETLFTTYDKNRDGALDGRELHDFIFRERAFFTNQIPSDGTATGFKVVGDWDSNRDRKLDRGEFQEFLRLARRDVDPRSVKRLPLPPQFASYDTNHDGVLDDEERKALRAALKAKAEAIRRGQEK
jgi:Ca2+-binding EF-hand superfamily protein